MSLQTWALLLAAAAGVWWLGRRIPLTGWRRAVALVGRAGALMSVMLALWGPVTRQRHDVPRRVVYLVDRSASIDAAQARWIAARVSALEAQRPAQVERALAVFGDTPAVVAPPARERLPDADRLTHVLEQAGPRSASTNLERALVGVSTDVLQGQGGSIVLLSDGRETAGDVSAITDYLRHQGIEVFPVAPPAATSASALWDELVVPPVVRQGAPVPVRLVLYSGASQPVQANVDIMMRGISLTRRSLSLRPGWQVFTLSVPAVQQGTMALDVALTIPESRMHERRTAYTDIEGPPQVLLVTDETQALPPLASVLRRREMDVALARLAELPSDPALLAAYDAVVLWHPAKSAITPPQAEALRAYVETQGGGLLTVGLGGNLADELNTEAPVDPLLPVAFLPKGLQESTRRICIVLLIDRSASMIGPRLAATKRAAVELVKQLSPEDLVGILAFDTQPYVVIEVQQVQQIGSRLVEKLVKLRSTGGTDILPALAAAANRLELTDAKVKHIILLSDGNTPIHEQAYEAIMLGLRQEGISISTIGIGSAFINEEFLQWLARMTGGRHYQLNSLDELPKLIARDTQESLERLPYTEGVFKPSRAPGTDWWAELGELPSLRGYLTAEAKPTARIDATVRGGEEDDPLLTRWHRGRGRVATFTSDADARWSPDWVRWPGYEPAWAQVVRWVMRPRFTEELFIRVEERQGLPHVIIEGALVEPRAQLVSADRALTLPLALTDTGPWRWRAPLEQIPGGWYQLRLETRAAQAEPGADTSVGGAPLAATRWIRIGSPSRSTEQPGQPPNEELLDGLARATGGSRDAPDRAFVPPTTTAATTAPIFAWWLPLALLALLCDIAARGRTML